MSKSRISHVSRSASFALALSTIIAVTSGCSSAPRKKSEHDLANILLGRRPPAIGVPESETGLREDQVNSLSPTVSEESQRLDREADKSRDQEEHEQTMSSFRARFMALKGEEERVESLDPAYKKMELERIASRMVQLRSELAHYGQSPGNLFFYGDGEERQAVILRRGEEVSRLDQEWAEDLASVEERLSDVRSVDALQKFRESVTPTVEVDHRDAPASGAGAKILRD